MCLLGRPSAANNTIRLRNTTRCAVVPARIQPCSVARCSGVIGKAGVRFMWRTVPNPNWKYKTFYDHCTRWRSLHEIAVVAMFLHEHGEEFAERYVEHQHIEAWRAARNYVRCQGRLGYEPLRPEELAKIEASAEIAIDRFGAAFKDQYGWASGTLKKKRGITFADIEQAAGVGHLRAHYQLACHNVHANPRGAFYRLGLSDERVLLAGVSDQGMSDPAHLTAISLTQCSVPLGLIFPAFDNLVALKIMMQVERDIGQALEDYSDQSSTAVSDP